VLLTPNTARTMSAVGRTTPTRGPLPELSADMLDLLAKLRAGGVLVTADKQCKWNTRMMAEIDGERVNASVVKGLIRRNLIRVVSRTARTKTWGPVSAVEMGGV
jgi:hypothetical protein